MLTDLQLRQIMPALAPDKLALYLPHLNQAMQAHAIDNALRAAAFVAQLAHESGEFRWMEEIWGPTAAQRRYEPACSLASDLGNTEAGDGKLFKGRGPIQITGRFNYRKFGDLLGLDLVADPALAATPAVAFSTAGLYWRSHGLNELADAEDFELITRRINGGTNGLADRMRYYERAKAVLAVGFVATTDAVTRGARSVRATPDPVAPLARGHEAIRKRARVRSGAARRAPAKAKPPVATAPPARR